MNVLFQKQSFENDNNLAESNSLHQILRRLQILSHIKTEKQGTVKVVKGSIDNFAGFKQDKKS